MGVRQAVEERHQAVAILNRSLAQGPGESEDGIAGVTLAQAHQVAVGDQIVPVQGASVGDCHLTQTVRFAHEANHVGLHLGHRAGAEGKRFRPSGNLLLNARHVPRRAHHQVIGQRPLGDHVGLGGLQLTAGQQVGQVSVHPAGVHHLTGELGHCLVAVLTHLAHGEALGMLFHHLAHRFVEAKAGLVNLRRHGDSPVGLQGTRIAAADVALIAAFDNLQPGLGHQVTNGPVNGLVAGASLPHRFGERPLAQEFGPHIGHGEWCAA